MVPHLIRSFHRASALTRKLLKVLCTRGYRDAFVKARVAAAIEHERLLSQLDCATVVDIGANRGQFALASRRCFPAARIVSFEPLSQPASLYQRILGNDPLITLHQTAIGEESGQAMIHVSAADDSSSLLPISALQQSMFAGTHEVGTELIRIEPLDNVLSRDEIKAPALLKIDVQGYELKTLRGCATLLDSFQYAYVECSFLELYEGQALADEVWAFMWQQGWALRGVFNVHYDVGGRAIQADFLFVAH
jgi:FkbM family methyltransferase